MIEMVRGDGLLFVEVLFRAFRITFETFELEARGLASSWSDGGGETRGNGAALRPGATLAAGSVDVEGLAKERVMVFG
jgi:hypothetical protein